VQFLAQCLREDGLEDKRRNKSAKGGIPRGPRVAPDSSFPTAWSAFSFRVPLRGPMTAPAKALALHHTHGPYQLNHPALRMRSCSARSRGMCCRTSAHASCVQGKLSAYRSATESYSQGRSPAIWELRTRAHTVRRGRPRSMSPCGRPRHRRKI